MTEQALSKLTDLLTQGATKLLFAFLILFIGFRISKLLMKVIKNSPNINKLDPGVCSFIMSFTGITLKIIVIISAAGVLGVPMTSFITILGSAGVAIGLALQGSLSNIAGGIIILIFKPFNVGDVISFGTTTGTVESIGIFYTKITTPDNRCVIVPNGSVTNQEITNISTYKTRRVDFLFSVAYDSDIPIVKQIIADTVKNHTKVLSDPEPLIRLCEHGANSLNFTCRIWCNNEDYWDVFYDVEELVKDEFDKNNISIPYPQMDVHISNN